jgi:hypothetical protein
MFVEEKKQELRAALRVLQETSNAPTNGVQEAMQEVDAALYHGFRDTGYFCSDEDFKAEIFSARVVGVILSAAKRAKHAPTNFYTSVCRIQLQLANHSEEISDAIRVHGGVAYIIDLMETFPHDEGLILCGVGVTINVFFGVGESSLAESFFEKLLDAMEMHHYDSDDVFYHFFCTAMECILMKGSEAFGWGPYFLPGGTIRLAHYVLYGIGEHTDNERSQKEGRKLLCILVGHETAQRLINILELTACQGAYAAACA